MRVAGNPATSAGTLATLAQDAHWSVRDWAKSNPSMPAEGLSALCTHDDIDMVSIALHPNVTDDMLQGLLTHEQWPVRLRAAEVLEQRQAG